MNAHTRIFSDVEASRGHMPLLTGLMGPSGAGKTFSAMRLAVGIQSVVGGDIFVIDTESGRAKHYADFFKFRHVNFAAPFGPMDYLSAIEQQVKKGAGVIVVDSMSHEHEGPGGILEMHEAEVERMGGGEQNNFRAWAKPKAERRKLISGLLQMNCNFIFCFRAKEKTKPGVDDRGKKTLVNQGWMPIAGEEFLFEQTANMLLLPGSQGVPTWRSEFPGERAMMKIPEQFRGILDDGKSQLSEDIGRKLAEWARGDVADSSAADEALCRQAAKNGIAELQSTWRSLGGARQRAIAHLLDGFKKIANQPQATPDPQPAAAAEASPGTPSSQDAPGDTPSDEEQPDPIWNDGYLSYAEGKSIFDVPEHIDGIVLEEADKKKWKNAWSAAEADRKAKGKV